MSLIVACGLRREARAIEGKGRDVVAVAGGGDAVRLEAKLDALARARPGIILSSGLAGALDPGLLPGNVVLDGDPGLIARLKHCLRDAIAGTVLGSDRIVATVAQKRALHAGAIAVDMESHIAARVAARHGLPFAAVRTISDGADETLPPAALVGMRRDGGLALGAVLASLVRDPAQLPALIRTGRHAGIALGALGGAHDALARGGIDRLDLRELGFQLR